MSVSQPHGGKLIQRVDLLYPIDFSLKTVELDNMALSDLELIANGGYSPLQGFMGKADYDSVVKRMRLSNDIPWSLPITLAADKDKASLIKTGEMINLVYNGTIYGVMKAEEKYIPDKNFEAEKVFQTTDLAHPGVKKLFERPEVYIGGPIQLVQYPDKGQFEYYYLNPLETRAVFKEMGAGKPLLVFRPVIQFIVHMNIFRRRL